MRSVCCVIMGACLGHLMVQGIIDGDVDKWLVASITFVAFLGYIVSRYKEEIN